MELQNTWQANSVTDLHTHEDKLNWIFMAFDQDGGGYIDVQETFSRNNSLLNILKSLRTLTNRKMTKILFLTELLC